MVFAKSRVLSAKRNVAVLASMRNQTPVIVVDAAKNVPAAPSVSVVLVSVRVGKQAVLVFVMISKETENTAVLAQRSALRDNSASMVLAKSLVLSVKRNAVALALTRNQTAVTVVDAVKNVRVEPLA